jgi:hypothetical protein
MRKFLLPVIVLAFLATAVAPSLAGPAERFPIPDRSFEALNPCTGNLTTVEFTNQILVIHDDVDPNNGQHVTGTITGDAVQSDGFAGRFTARFGMNLQDISNPLIVGEFANTFSGTIRNGSGALILLHVVFHVTIPPAGVGELRGFVDNVSLECLGKPS